jgi:gamma-glutamylputrescine oxidase
MSAAGMLHPLNYALGLGEGGAWRKASICTRLTRRGVETTSGVVAQDTARVWRGRGMACWRAMRCLRDWSRASPSASCRWRIISWRPSRWLNARDLIADHLAVSDSRFVVNYFRMSADGRLIFGGGERYTPEPPADMAAIRARAHAQGVSAIGDATRIDYAWGGLVSVTMSRLPHIGRTGDLFFAHGYSGRAFCCRR